MSKSSAERTRCAWSGTQPDYILYHDTEWGVPEYDDRRLFEKLILDGFQAGLSWITILRKRENFRRAFRGFEPETIARWGARDVARLMGDAGIVRNRMKIEAAIASARAWVAMRERGESFSAFLWNFVGGAPRQNAWKAMGELPAETPESRAMSKALKLAGFRFCGPTICYAFMQAAGFVNDHTTDCFRYKELAKKGKRRMK